jgi:hypothetical protein
MDPLLDQLVKGGWQLLMRITSFQLSEPSAAPSGISNYVFAVTRQLDAAWRDHRYRPSGDKAGAGLCNASHDQHFSKITFLNLPRWTSSPSTQFALKFCSSLSSSLTIDDGLSTSTSQLIRRRNGRRNKSWKPSRSILGLHAKQVSFYRTVHLTPRLAFTLSAWTGGKNLNFRKCFQSVQANEANGFTG